MTEKTRGVIDATDETFATEVEQATGITVVDFHATWCGPCQLVGPIIEQLAETYAGRVRVVKVDVDESPVSARRFGIRSIPSVLFFRDGKPVDTLVGAAGRAEYERRIARLAA